MRIEAAVIALEACLFGCRTELPLSTTDQDRLTVAERQWASRGFTNYSIDLIHICSCPPSFRDRARIEVMGGTVQRVTLLGSLAVITDSRKQRYRTVEEVFQEIRDANGQESLKRVTFSLDPILGIPTYVHWAAKSATPELELIIEMSNPQPLLTPPLPR